MSRWLVLLPRPRRVRVDGREALRRDDGARGGAEAARFPAGEAQLGAEGTGPRQLSHQFLRVAARRRRRESILVTQSNLAVTYENQGLLEEALRLKRDVYSGHLRLYGEEHRETLKQANNYSVALNNLRHFEETRALMRKTLPVARRVVGGNDEITLHLRWAYAQAIYNDPAATLDDLREAVTTLEDTERIARRVFGGVHPLTKGIEHNLQNARAALRARRGA